MRPGFQFRVPHVANTTSNSWLPDYPNPADLRFNYYKLMNDAGAAGQPLANAPSLVDAPLVAVIGAGAAGMTAARELWRAGYKVVIFEASSRVSGRLYTETAGSGLTAYEFGAMRMPFFNGTAGPAAQSTNCLLAYYLNQDQNYSTTSNATYADLADFPNPGSAPGGTGIYMNNGAGPNDVYTSPTLIDWPDNGQPQNADLQAIAAKVSAFVTLFTNYVSAAYTGATWDTTWQQIAQNYDKMSFSDLVFTPAVTTPGPNSWLGGFGMNDYESSLFYTIGAGDGSWGAFYAVGAMWFIRCVMFGFNSDLQLVSGLNDATSLPHYNDASVTDNNGNSLTPPLFRGIQSLSELLFYLPPPGGSQSLYDATKGTGLLAPKIHVNSPVTKIEKETTAGVTYLRVYTGNTSIVTNYAVVTAPIWAAQLSIDFAGFNTANDLPWQVTTAMAEQHLIASCKVFLPLTEAYWQNNDCAIPQILVTDTFVQDAYGLSWSGQSNDAAILASYTWEDDALKLLAMGEQSVVNAVTAELNDITSSTLNNSFAQYVDTSRPAQVFQWTMQPTYHGCAKLYRQRNWDQCYALMTYNQTYSASSHLYFAGESYGTEGGWTEPALRMALDAVLNLVNNSGGTFTNSGFSFANDYPGFMTGFTPNDTYPQNSATA